MTLANHIPDDTKMVSGVKDSLTTQQEQGEPVAWMDKSGITHKHKHFEDMTPLYTTPQQRKPLTDEQILRLLSKIDECAVRLPRGLREFARAIEAAHGIKENT